MRAHVPLGILNRRTEIIAGCSTFLATAYIIVVNPTILVQAGLPFNAVLSSTILVCFFSSVAMGLYARNPIVVAPGMGLNAFFTFSVVQGMHVPWPIALGAFFWSGIIFILLSVFNVRTYIVKSIPQQLRYGVAAGIGLFITLIGFVNAGFIIHRPATVIGAANLNVPLLIFLAGLAATSIFIVRSFRAAIVFGIAVTTLLAWPVGRLVATSNPTLVNWHGWLSLPDFSLVFSLDLMHSLKWSVWPVIFSFLFTDMFDSLSTLIGLAEAADLLDENGEPRNLKKALLVDGFATAIAGLTGSSPGTAYIESAVGINAGGRTGTTAIVAALLFIPFLFVSPLLSLIPAIATAPALVLVGVFMMKTVTRINWQQADDAIPAFLAMVLIPFSYSITQGIVWGFLSWTVLKLACGKRKELTWGLLCIDCFAIAAMLL